MLLKLYPNLHEPCVGIDENAALVVADGKVRVVSGDGKAGCVVKQVVKGMNIQEKQDSKVNIKQFTEKHGSVSLEDFLSGRF